VKSIHLSYLNLATRGPNFVEETEYLVEFAELQSKLIFADVIVADS